MKVSLWIWVGDMKVHLGGHSVIARLLVLARLFFKHELLRESSYHGGSHMGLSTNQL
jgi:hypothetical protein